MCHRSLSDTFSDLLNRPTFRFRNEKKSTKIFISHRSLYYDLLGALFCALAAARALIIVNNSYIIVHVNGIKLTLLGTEGTSDTACLTYAHDILAPLVARALHLVGLSLGHQSDDVLRTGLYAGLTSGTFILIHHCDSVNYVYGIELTSLYAGSIAHAAILTALVI